MDRRPAPRGVRVLEERDHKALGPSSNADENPYWQAEELEPHPDPSLGCIRRGHCCRSSPGWFAPGQVEQAAALLGLEPDAMVRRYLVIDSLELDGERVEVFVPVKLGRDGEPLLRPGSRVDRLYRMLRSPCIFFDGSGCSIYAARPIECAHYLCTHEAGENLSHEAIARMWREDPTEAS